MKPKIHLRNLRLFNNAGMPFPDCYANAWYRKWPLLGTSTDKGHLPTTGDRAKVTCRNCKRLQGFGHFRNQ